MRRDARGIVLVLVAGILSLLAIMAASFVRLREIGRNGAGGQIVDARAGLLARSGVEYATARLTLDLPAPRVRTRANARDDWTCRDSAGTPLARLHNPSWSHGEPYADGSPADGRYGTEVGSPDAFDTSAHDLDGDRVHTPWTGRLRGTMQTHGDLFVVRVTSEEGKLYVNGGYLDGEDRPDPTVNGTPDHRDIAAGYNLYLRRVLNMLGKQPEVVIPDLGDRVIGNRPIGGYASLTDLNARCGISKDLSAYLTCHAWVDRSVVRPHGEKTPVPAFFGAIADLKVARGSLILEPCGRAPVNMNEAPREVIQACLDGLRCAFLRQDVDVVADPMKTVRMSVSTATAATIAREIVRSRAGAEDANGNGWLDPGEDADGDGILDAPYVSWMQFRYHLEKLVQAAVFTVPDYAGDVVDMVVANANPNTDLNKNSPDRTMYRRVDKSDLEVYSTEFSLHPTAGVCFVESLGRIRGLGGSEASCAQRRTILQRYRPIRHSTQRDFVGGRGAPTDYLTPASAGAPLPPGLATYGAAQGLGGTPGTGLSLATYPEGVACLPTNASDVDGQIALATVESASLPGAMFVHRFTDTWTADIGGVLSSIPSTDCSGRQADGMLQQDPSVPTSDPSRPGTLLPDGAHAQDGRVAMYATEGNVPPFHGVLQCWIKGSMLRPCQARIDVSIGGSPAPATTGSHWFGLGMKFNNASAMQYGAVIEDGSFPTEGVFGPPDLTHERCATGSSMVWSSQWGLATYGWDMDDPAPDAETREAQFWGRFDGVDWMTPAGTGAYGPFTWSLTPVPMSGADRRIGVGLLRPAPVGTATADGSGLNLLKRMGSNAVVDELQILDLGGIGVDAKSAGEALASLRFQEGRYYKGNDGAFTSMDLPSGPGGAAVRVARVYWTEWTPRAPTWWTRPSICSSNTLWSPLEDDPNVRESHTAVQIVSGPPGSETVEYETSAAMPADYVRASRAGVSVSGPWRYRVLFRPTPGWTAAQYLDTPVLETPFLDDVTILTVPAGGPIRLAWSE